MEVIFISKKYSILVALAVALLAGTIIWRETGKINNTSQTIIIQAPPETTVIQTEEISVVTTLKKKVTTKPHSVKSTNSTKIAEKTAGISEVYTTPVEVYVNINSAGADELMQIKGVGEYLAGQIISYREENGGFRNIEELINVSGIGESIFEEIRDYVYVENPVYEVNEPELTAEVEIIETTAAEEVTEASPTLEDLAPISLNEADIELLMFLPYVDEKIAKGIIQLREEIGVFSNPYELLLVDGMTEEILSEIIQYVYI